MINDTIIWLLSGDVTDETLVLGFSVLELLLLLSRISIHVLVTPGMVPWYHLYCYWTSTRYSQTSERDNGWATSSHHSSQFGSSA